MSICDSQNYFLSMLISKQPACHKQVPRQRSEDYLSREIATLCVCMCFLLRWEVFSHSLGNLISYVTSFSRFRLHNLFLFPLLLCSVDTPSKSTICWTICLIIYPLSKCFQEASVLLSFILLISIPFRWHILLMLHPVRGVSILSKAAHLVYH